MHVIKRKTLVEFYEHLGREDAKGPLEAWYYEVNRARWESPADVKTRYATASILKDSRVVFNIGGNKYRLVVKINYTTKTVFVRFLGTHEEYDKINAEVI
jgi:mRNA interferase HigB